MGRMGERSESGEAKCGGVVGVWGIECWGGRGD